VGIEATMRAAPLLLIFTVALCAYAEIRPPIQSAQPAAGSGTIASPPVADRETVSKLTAVKRIYIENFGEDATSKELQALLINSLTASKRFIITENKDKADAVLKGVGTTQTSQELHATKEGTAVATTRGGAGISDASASTETITQAQLTVRIVSADGDVIWSTEKESKGAKYKNASADVADEVVKQLLWDLDKLDSTAASGPSASKPQ
jgi:hypothetical protein